MHDLIYAEKSAFDDIKKVYPSAVYEDARDEIHEERFGVEIPEIENLDRDYIKFLIRAGLAGASLHINLMMYDDPKTLKAILDEVKAEEEGKKTDHA